MNVQENFSNDMFKLRRKDLEFDEFIQQKESNLSESIFLIVDLHAYASQILHLITIK